MNSSMAFSISVVNSRMAFSISVVKSPHIHLHTNPISLHLSSSSPPFILCFPSHLFLSNRRPRIFVPKSASSHSSSSQDAYGSDLLRKPVNSPVSEAGVEESTRDSDVEEESKRIEEEGWVDWEDQILEDTVPLVGFVRMILHSGKYESGDRLSPEHERTILERLLPYHPECEKKIGSGVDYITVGYHPDFESSRCLFIARKDGQLVDFSYWKCLKGLIKKNYPLYADSFILRHFRRRVVSEGV